MAIKKKLVIVGDGNCGKTCLLTVYCKGDFPMDSQPTTFDTFKTDIQIGKKELELTLWDTSGQEGYGRLRPLSYSDANVILICFSIDAPNTLCNVFELWLPEVQYFCPDVPIILVGNKKDLRYDPDVINNLAKVKLEPVTREQGEAMSEKINSVSYVECSSLNKDGVQRVFDSAVKAILYQKKTGCCRCKCSLL